VKLTRDDSAQWKLISFQKRDRPTKLEDMQLLPLYNDLRPITQAKVDVVNSLLSYIPPIHHGFYDIVMDYRNNSSNSAEVMDVLDDGNEFYVNVFQTVFLLLAGILIAMIFSYVP
jgi:hypothetical protein